MTNDYWAWLADNDIPALKIEAALEADCGYGFETSSCPSLSANGATELGFSRQLERAAILYRRYEAEGTKAVEKTGSVAVKERVKELYTRLMAKGYSIPDVVVGLAKDLDLWTPTIDLRMLPTMSTLWHFTFTLGSEYISKDDAGLYAIDNPMRKEKILKLPMVASTTWKGALRSAYRQVHGADNEAPGTTRLFGVVRDNETGVAGSLHFFPSYFSRLGVAVINPHDRKTGIGTLGPILFEMVPAEATANFTLLYVPAFDTSIKEVATDIEAVSHALHALFMIYGFGAKTSSGSGVVKDKLVNGQLEIKAQLVVAADAQPTALASSPAIQEGLPRYLESPTRLSAALRNEAGGLKTEAAYRAEVERSGQTYTKPNKLLYEKAQKWWEHQQQQAAEVSKEPIAPTAPAVLPETTVRSAASLTDLVKEASRVADALRDKESAV